MTESNENQFDEEDIQRILRELLSGQMPSNLPEGLQIDPTQFAQAAGLPTDPAVLQSLFASLQQAMQSGDGGIDWEVAKRTAIEVAKKDSITPNAAQRAAIDRDFTLAGLWLSEVTTIGESSELPRAISRVEWVFDSINTWAAMSEPVALSISDALMNAMAENSPEELRDALAGAGKMIRGVAGALFAMQLGTVVGRLASEVVSGGDIGVQLFERNVASLLPENITAFAEGLEQPKDQVQLYLAVREQAHTRLFHHARWLRLHLQSAIIDYARGIRIDTERIGELAADFDPSNPEQIRDALTNGSLIPPKTDAQKAAHARLETTLALIEGWVDEVTKEAVSRLPGAEAIAEMVRRRRASGGPAESAFSTLVGLELRPRRLREAAAMWARLSEVAGADARDAVWAHPDLLPTSDEIDQPDLLIARLDMTGLIASESGTAGKPTQDEFDRAIAELLESSDAARPIEGEFGDLVSDPGTTSGSEPGSEPGSESQAGDAGETNTQPEGDT